MNLAELALICLVAILGPTLALPGKLRHCVVIGELLVGIALGATGLKVLDSADPTFSFMGSIGFALVMVVASPGSCAPRRPGDLPSGRLRTWIFPARTPTSPRTWTSSARTVGWTSPPSAGPAAVGWTRRTGEQNAVDVVSPLARGVALQPRSGEGTTTGGTARLSASFSQDRDGSARLWLRGRGIALEAEVSGADRDSLGVVSTATHQAFGTFAGWATDAGAERHTVDGLVGWAEEADNRR